MFLRVAIGFAIALAGIIFAISLSVTRTNETRIESEKILQESRIRIESALSELKQIPSFVAEGDLSSAKDNLHRAQSLSSETRSQLSSVNNAIQSVSHIMAKTPSGASIYWDKDEALRNLENYRRSLEETTRLINEASRSIGSVSRGIIDLNRRVTDIEGRVHESIETLEERMGNPSPHTLISAWLPAFVSIASMLGGISTIGLGWRKDRREVIELRMLHDKAVQNEIESKA